MKKSIKQKRVVKQTSVISPFVSIFRFNAVIFMSFSHRVTQILTFGIICIATTLYGIIGLSKEYPILLIAANFITSTFKKLPKHFIAFACINLIFYYSLTEFRFTLLELKILPMTEKVMNITAYLAIVFYLAFCITSGIMFLL